MVARLISPSAQAGDRIAFIDLEASGLNVRSWPIEVGWAFETGPAESMLIQPQDAWSDEGWDGAAEKLHGLTRGVLQHRGERPGVVCERVNKALGGCAVYSDAPDWDAFWIVRLYEAAGRKPAFDLRHMADLINPVLGDNAEAIIAEASRIAPRKHRAAADARHLQTLYTLVFQNR